MRRNPFAPLIPMCLALLLAGPVAAAEPDPAARDEQILKDAKVGSDGPALLDLFRKRTVTDADLTKVKALIKQLGDDSFAARQKATNELVAVGPLAVPLLRQALADPDIEIVRRAEDCLRQIDEGHSAAVAAAAARLIAVRKPPGAVEVLLAYLPSADDEYVADAVRGALAANAVRDGKADPALVAALTDKAPVRRAGAAVALARADLADQKPAVRKLLEDPEAAVRLRVGLALAAAKDKDAVPVLIQLLAELPAAQLWPVEDLLYRLAEDKAPAVTAGTDEASRKRFRDAWAAWWKDNGDKADLAKLDAEPALLGYTTMILLDQNKIIEMDANKKLRWSIDDVQFPLDAQVLPGDRILVTENQGNRVTERDFKGKILWQKAIDAPTMAQRLPNGNTFICTRPKLVEVDRDGKEVFTLNAPDGELFMRAQRLRNGDIACVTSAYRFQRFDPTGKKLNSFAVDIRTFGGRIEVLPNGCVLVPQYSANRVVEQDAQGNVVWEVKTPFANPIAAVRLTNGNTLVTSMNPQAPAVELDRDGNKVWEYVPEMRVTRAWRR